MTFLMIKNVEQFTSLYGERYLVILGNFPNGFEQIFADSLHETRDYLQNFFYNFATVLQIYDVN